MQCIELLQQFIDVPDIEQTYLEETGSANVHHPQTRELFRHKRRWKIFSTIPPGYHGGCSFAADSTNEFKTLAIAGMCNFDQMTSCRCGLHRCHHISPNFCLVTYKLGIFQGIVNACGIFRPHRLLDFIGRQSCFRRNQQIVSRRLILGEN